MVTSGHSGTSLAVRNGMGIIHTQRIRTGLAGLAVVAFLAAATVTTAFFQSPTDSSPESGTAQVVAQGIVDIGDEDLRWQIVERAAPAPANAENVTADLGFVTVDAGVMLIDDLASGEQFRLPAGESLLTRAGAEQTRVALGSEEARYREMALVPATTGEPVDGTALFASEPFAGLGARHDLDLVADVLAPGAQLGLPAGSLPTLVLIVDGTVDLGTEAGDVISLGVGEAASLTGALTLTAADSGAIILAAYAGPAVPRLAQAAGTPSAGRVVETAQGDSAASAASPAAAGAGEETDDSDEDGDGLSANRESRAGTDPALADTDEDGLTDGQEVREFDSDPLAPDSDGDGVLDGDEVVQGTNPTDTATGAVQDAPVEGIPAEAAPAEGDAAPAEEPAAEEVVPAEEIAPEAAPATPGDSDADGLEDAIENELGTDPFDTDTDDDGLTDGDEYYVAQTGTRNPDSDGDAVLDGDEVAAGTNPNDPNS